MLLLPDVPLLFADEPYVLFPPEVLLLFPDVLLPEADCDEFADFIEGDRENAKLIQRIAQMARACGIYMVIATVRYFLRLLCRLNS